MPLYHSNTYWNGRYFDEVDHFDWYCEYDDITDSLQPIVNKLSQLFKASPLQVLDFGCGTSLFSHKLSQHRTNLEILAIDGSKHCIEFMHYNQNNNDSIANDSTLEYKQIMFETISFNKKSANRHKYHLIVDKATADSLLCGINGFDKVQRIINQNIYHLLKPNGVYLLISHNPNRYNLFEPSKWAITRTAIQIPYFRDNQIRHAKITNNIRKYLNENNRILVQYMPKPQVDDSQRYLLELQLQRMEKEKQRQREKEEEEKKEKKPIVFNIEHKTPEELLEERRKRRLEYEATLNAAKEESEKFRKEFIKKQRVKRERLRKKEEELKLRKIVIDTDQILAELEKEKEGKADEEEESESDGGYMTDSSEEDNRKETQRQEMIAKLMEEHEENTNTKKKVKKKKKKKKKTKTTEEKQMKHRKTQKQYYDETLPIYQRFRSKYCLLTDVEATHEPYCCFNENGMDQKHLNKYQQLLTNQLYRDAQQTKLVSKTFYMYCATKML